MSKILKRTPFLVKWFLKLALIVGFFTTLLVGFFLLIRQNHYGTPIQRWNKLNKPSFNLIKFFGWKWNFLIILTIFMAGLLYRYPVWRLIEYHLQRKKLIEFSKIVHMAVVSADVGKGKTLLLSILANSLPYGRKKVGFVSNVPDAQLLSYNDINFHEPISRKDNYRLNKYFFLDETNFWIDGVEFQKNRLYHKGVAFFLQIIRHHKGRLWISATRDNHVWVAVREIVNYYVKLGGVKHFMDIGGFSFYTLRVQFYSQSWELQKEFNILVPNWDFELYDSYWLAGTDSFRPILEEKVRRFQPKWQELSPEDKVYEEEAERQLKGKSPEVLLKIINNSLGKNFLSDFYESLSSQKITAKPTTLLKNEEPVQSLPDKSNLQIETKLEEQQKKFVIPKNDKEDITNGIKKRKYNNVIPKTFKKENYPGKKPNSFRDFLESVKKNS